MTTTDRRCNRCDETLQGLRADARWCSTTCRTLAYRERRAERETRAAVRDAVRIALRAARSDEK